MRATMRKTLAAAIIAGAATLGAASGPARVPVSGQIALPHNYYYRELYLAATDERSLVCRMDAPMGRR